MSGLLSKINFRSFFFNIVLPVVLTIGIFVFLIFFFVIPYFEESLMNQKNEMMKELVSSAIGTVSAFEKEVQLGKIKPEIAKQNALLCIKNIRYGKMGKDYFWIMDKIPTIIMHPYRPELDNTNVSEYTDAAGNKLFLEMAKVVAHSGEGFVEYRWQWLDDSTKIVPKMSFVKLFEPWGWIIGTGIYIEDVKKEIAEIEKKLFLTSLAIIALMSLLLTLIVKQDLKNEIKRREAEDEVRSSREKYKLLVESSNEGSAMIIEGVCVFANEIFSEITGLKASSELLIGLSSLIAPEDKRGIESITSFFSGNETFLNLETFIKNPDFLVTRVFLSVSKVILDEKSGFIVSLRNLSRSGTTANINSINGEILTELNNALNFGIFEAQYSKVFQMTYSNDFSLKMFGIESLEKFRKLDFLSLLEKVDEKQYLIEAIKKEETIKNFSLQIRKEDSGYAVVSLSAVVKRDKENSNLFYIGGVIEDITRDKMREVLKGEVYNDLQASVNIMSQPVKGLIKNIIWARYNTSVKKAIEVMTNHNSDVLFLRSDSGEIIGIITDKDIRKRIAGTDSYSEKPIYEFMSSPIVSMNEDETLQDAVIIMQKKEINHILVKNKENFAVGTIKGVDISYLQNNTADFLTSGLQKATSVEEIKNLYLRLPIFVNALVEGGARTSAITKSITAVSDIITQKLANLIISEIGMPPVAFVFIALGSEGRREQTLLTDQDNAIIYEDPTEGEEIETAKYFALFGERMCGLLNYIGYNYCEGGIMAQNSKWNAPFTTWKKYFASWITTPEPQNLLEAVIFFDFRAIYGEESLCEGLREFVFSIIGQNPQFLVHLARAGVSYRTPLSFFGKIQTESSEKHSHNLNIKNPLRVIVHLLRVYTMREKLTDTNSIQRLNGLYEKSMLSPSLYHDLLYAFDFMMVLQFRTQARSVNSGKKLSNLINLAELSTIEVSTLKNIFGQISTFQSKLKYDFGINE